MKVKIKTDDGHTITVTGPNAEELLDQIKQDLEELESYRILNKSIISAAMNEKSWNNIREQILIQAEAMAQDVQFH